MCVLQRKHMPPTQRLELPPSKSCKIQTQLRTHDLDAALRGVLRWNLQELQSNSTLSRSSVVLVLVQPALFVYALCVFFAC